MSDSASQVMVNQASPEQLKELVLELVQGSAKLKKELRGAKDELAPTEDAPEPSKDEARPPKSVTRSLGMVRRAEKAGTPLIRPTPRPEEAEEDVDGEEFDEEEFQEQLEQAIDNETIKPGQQPEKDQGNDNFANACSSTHRSMWMKMSRRFEAPDAAAKWPEVAKLWLQGSHDAASLQNQV